MINIKIVPNDVSTVAKVVLFDEKDRMLFLKRSKYVEKHSGEWDLPGGHLKANENLESGLKREVKEESGIDIDDITFVKKIGNLHFFYAKYNSQPVKLSYEHVDYKFFTKNELDKSEKFQNVALEALELKNDKHFS